jgi:chromodomain-helicase-DNA-binding protein 4
MVKSTCEEKIMLVGKRKLALDHVIVQRINNTDDDEQEDVASILAHGAKALFEENADEVETIKYTDEDLDKWASLQNVTIILTPLDRILDRTESTESLDKNAADAAKTFSFARVWEKSSGELKDIDQGEEEIAQAEIDATRNFWDKVIQENDLAQAQKKRAQIAEGGRGKRTRVQRVSLTLLVMF